MNKKNLHGWLAFVSLALLFYVVVIYLRFVILPVFFLALGFLSYLWSGRKALALFLFLLPLVSSTPDIFFNGYPFNYMGITLFYLSGIISASRLKKEKAEFNFPGYGIYLLFLVMLGVSVLFVFLRWSNLTLSPLAFLRDTPVAPGGERLSFACIFPVITLALFALSPFLAYLLRHWHFRENEIFAPLKAGFFLSLLLALVQKWLAPDLLAQGWWGVKMNQVNGGFSDFNAFGFFAGVIFLYQALSLTDALPWRNGMAPHGAVEGPGGFPRHPGVKALLPEIFFLLSALAAIFVSGCRTAFLFVLLAIIRIFLSRKTALLFKVAVVLLLAASLFVSGGILKRRLQRTIVQAARISTAADLFHAVDAVGSGRLTMLRDGARMIARFPLSGIGAGNFIFYLNYLRYGEKYYEDLPLNQYLLIFSETGMAGGLVFIIFLIMLFKRLKPGRMRFVIAAMAFALLFNNFFWFPECLLLFWVFVACGGWPAASGTGLKPAWFLAAVAVYAAFQVLDFRALHPEALTRQKGIAYDYGFWPRETNERGAFSWTGRAAGRYFSGAAARDFALFCGAPPVWLQKESMAVALFWRGRMFQRVVFVENQLRKFMLPPGQEGFLEIRVHPTFNSKAMNLGADARELGVQFMELKKPQP